MNILNGAAHVLNVIGTLAGVFSAVAIMVRAVESPGGGAEKKQAVLDGIGAIYDATDQWLAPLIPKERLLQIASVFIDIVVALDNAIGVFQHRQDALPNS